MAQDPAQAGASVRALGGTYSFDLGNLTGPGAFVVCFAMLLRAERLPAFRIRIYHYNDDEPTGHWTRAEMKKQRNDDDEDDKK